MPGLFFWFAWYHLDVSWTLIIVRRYVESICLSKGSSGHWIVYFEIGRCFSLLQSLWCSVCWLIYIYIPCCCLFIGIYSCEDSLSLLCLLFRGYKIDIIKIFVLITDLLCFESNAICMLFCRPLLLGLNRCELILLLWKSFTMWFHVCLVLFAGFFIPISLSVIR